MSKKMIIYDKVVGVLTESFPNFQFDKADSELTYIVAGEFANYLFELYKAKAFDDLQRGLNFIEELHLIGDEQTKELATIGFLEGIQNIWGNRGTDPEEIFKLLGEESKKWWNQLNKFWQDEIKVVGETIDEE